MPTGAPHPLDAVLPPTVGIQGGGAVWTDQPKILQSMVIANAIDVVEYQRHWSTSPKLALTAKLAHRLLPTLTQETTLDVLSRVSRVPYENIRQRPLPPLQIPTPSCTRVEVLGRDLPYRGVFLENPPGTASRAQTEPAQALRPRQGSCDRLSCLPLGVAQLPPRHRTYVREYVGWIYWGARARTGDATSKVSSVASYTTPQ